MRSIITAVGIIAVALLTGCSSSTAQYTPETLTGMLQPKPGMAKLIVYYPYSYASSDITASAKANGQKPCALKAGTFAVSDLHPGIETVSVSLCTGSGISTLKIKTLAGRKYYVQVLPNDKSVLGRISEYGFKTTESKYTHSENGAFYLDLTDEGYAIKQLLYMKNASQK